MLSFNSLNNRLRIPRLICHPCSAYWIERSVFFESCQVDATVEKFHNVGVMECGRLGFLSFFSLFFTKVSKQKKENIFNSSTISIYRIKTALKQEFILHSLP